MIIAYSLTQDGLKMSYGLESYAESDRLKFQSKIKAYDFNQEFPFFKIRPGQKVLDAGCGNGENINLLSEIYTDSSFYGCDFSHDRINEAQSRNSNVHFDQANLLNLPYEANSFDLIYSRYVYEHLDNPHAVTKELHRVLKPGGKIILIDFYNLFLGLETKDQEFNTLLDKLGSEIDFNLKIGNQLDEFLVYSGFEVMQDFSKAYPFDDPIQLDMEVENNRKRIDQSKDTFIKSLGSELEYTRFKNTYLSLMKDKSSYYSFDKHIVTGVKK